MRQRHTSFAQNGFTLIELLVTVAIVAILASVAMPLSELTQQRAKEQELRQYLRDIRTAIDAYKQAWDEGRIVRSLDQSGYPPKLSVLVEGVEDAKSPVTKKIYFLRRIPMDPFAENAVNTEPSWGLRSYESPPDAPKEGKDVYDVYSLSTRTGLNGIPYREW
ncbi:MAG: general secretion pathway protein GspG [Betaproteobacteria bacterium RBG_16_56_24]|nr:MAG: general secretion pathway protein GspG [Betaproteobacteria bacterium RBG_16_56_24]